MPIIDKYAVVQKTYQDANDYKKLGLDEIANYLAFASIYLVFDLLITALMEVKDESETALVYDIADEEYTDKSEAGIMFPFNDMLPFDEKFIWIQRVPANYFNPDASDDEMPYFSSEFSTGEATDLETEMDLLEFIYPFFISRVTKR